MCYNISALICFSDHRHEQEPTISRLRELLSYDSRTGRFEWRHSGKRAATRIPRGGNYILDVPGMSNGWKVEGVRSATPQALQKVRIVTFEN
jgi:hypothetical protein